MTTNQKAFLDMLAISELGQALIDVSDDGYDVIVGSTPNKPNLLPHYDDCNRKIITLKNGLKSTASGRYQLLARYYDAYKKQLGLIDFSPDNQDAIALQQIKECGAIPFIENGNFEIAVSKVAHIWASLPNAGYGQHENEISVLKATYIAAGGTLAEETNT